MKLRKIFNDFHPLTKLVFDVFMVIILAIVFFFISLSILSALTGEPTSVLLQASKNPETDIIIVKYVQLISSISIFLLPPLVIAFFFDKNPLNYYDLNKSAAFLNYFNVIFLIIISFPIVNFLAEFNRSLHLPASLSEIETAMKNMEETAKILTDKLLNVSSINDLLFNLLLIAFIPALGEEIFFRGMLQKHFSELFKNKHIAIFVTAVIFSAIHFQFFTFIPRLFLGIILGYLYVWSKSLWLNIFTHFTNNAVAVVAYFYMIRKGLNPENLEQLGSSSQTLTYSIISIVFLFLILYFIRKNEMKSKML